jgi:O-antigen chain-terminating methyltransferase
MSELFYKAFEEKFRGSRETVKSRLQVYLPFIQPVFKAFPQYQTLDLGCGRGEWLELLTEQGFNAKGVDLDDGMLQDCRDRGLQVETSDALTYIQTLPEESVNIVSGFHIAEHLSFNVLMQLVEEAKRVLVPGGLLILETPNPENISVGTHSFYIDPTHDKPIPPELLSFLPEHYGYCRVKVLRLQDTEQLRVEPNPRLINVFNGVSPDYAVVAQTQGVPLLMEALSPAFEQNFGLTLHTLAERFQESLNQRLNFIEAQVEVANERASSAEAQAQQSSERAASAEAQAQQSSERAASAEAQAQLASDRATKAEAQAHQSSERAVLAEARALNAEVLAQQYASQFASAYNNKSWRISIPLPWTLQQLRKLREHGLKFFFRSFAKKVLGKLMPFVMSRPLLKKLSKKIANRLGVADRVKHLALTIPHVEQLVAGEEKQNSSLADLTRLSNHARQVYSDLKAAIDQQRKGSH